jgi:hypothetical protein
LSTVTSQLNQAVHQAHADATEIGTDLVEVSVQHLFGVLSELQLLIGSPISVEDVVAIKARLDNLGEELAAVEPAIGGTTATEPDAKARVARALEEVQGIRLQLESALVGGRVLKQEAAACPSCGTSATAQLGSLPGDSAIALCPNTQCALRYHVHRGPDGRVFTRLPGGGGASSTSIKVGCPHCGNQVPLTVPRAGASAQKRYCLNCFAELQIDPATQEAVILQEAVPPTAGELRIEGGVVYIVCSLCRELRRSMTNRAGTYYAVCATDNKLLRAKSQATGPAAPTPPNPPLQQVG